MSREKELKRLIDDQSKDQNSPRVKSQIINPIKYRLLNDIFPDERERAIYILYKTDFSIRFISRLFDAHHEEIRRIIDKIVPPDA